MSKIGFADEAVGYRPYWRSDIHIEVDLIEEVARIQGYDKIPNTLLAEPLPHLNPDPIFNLKREYPAGLVADGFSEVLNFSLVGIGYFEKTLAGTETCRNHCLCGWPIR